MSYFRGPISAHADHNAWLGSNPRPDMHITQAVYMAREYSPVRFGAQRRDVTTTSYKLPPHIHANDWMAGYLGRVGAGSARRPVRLAGGAAAGSGFLAPAASAPVGGSGRCSLPASSRPEAREGWERGGDESEGEDRGEHGGDGGIVGEHGGDECEGAWGERW